MTPPATTAAYTTVVTDPPVVHVAGPHNDPSDFYGLGIGLAAIVVAIAFTRLVFRGRGRSRDAEERR